MNRGFFDSLFDLSFTSFITTKIIKVIYVLSLVLIGLFTLVVVVAAFHESAGVGTFTLVIGAPISALIYTIYTRMILEFIIQVFRIGETLRDQNNLQRVAFSAAGWLPDDAQQAVYVTAASAPVPAAPAPAASAPAASDPAASPSPSASATPAACPNCGAETAPGTQFCRSCGQKLI
jgi:Domain of unknown function (DUF4282)/zinc-ribbon domain